MNVEVGTTKSKEQIKFILNYELHWRDVAWLGWFVGYRGNRLTSLIGDIDSKVLIQDKFCGGGIPGNEPITKERRQRT